MCQDETRDPGAHCRGIQRDVGRGGAPGTTPSDRGGSYSRSVDKEVENREPSVDDLSCSSPLTGGLRHASYRPSVHRLWVGILRDLCTRSAAAGCCSGWVDQTLGVTSLVGPRRSWDPHY